MKEILIISGLCYLGILLLAAILLWISPKWMVQDYPKEWEEQEDQEIKKKFDERRSR